MNSPPKRTAKDLLLHMADEANTIIEIEVCKSRARSASLKSASGVRYAGVRPLKAPSKAGGV